MSRLYTIILLLITIFTPALSAGQEISGPEVKIVNNDIYVTFRVLLEDKNIQEIRNGIDKEFKLYIDLFRVWKIWPDEFVLGKFYSRKLKSAPIKKEFISTSYDGNIFIEKRFKSFESMLDSALTVRDFKLSSIRELDPGQYFVRITAESKIRKLPPVIGYLFVFVSENEFRIVKGSGIFTIEGTQ